jgi:hypothetical protein
VTDRWFYAVGEERRGPVDREAHVTQGLDEVEIVKKRAAAPAQ